MLKTIAGQCPCMDCACIFSVVWRGERWEVVASPYQDGLWAWNLKTREWAEVPLLILDRPIPLAFATQKKVISLVEFDIKPENAPRTAFSAINFVQQSKRTGRS